MWSDEGFLNQTIMWKHLQFFFLQLFLYKPVSSSSQSIITYTWLLADLPTYKLKKSHFVTFTYTKYSVQVILKSVEHNYSGKTQNSLVHRIVEP